MMLIAKEAVWLLAASSVAASVALDMHRLRINQVGGIGLRGWAIASLCTGPVAGAVYLGLRRIARRQLVNSVWQAVGGTSTPIAVRRARLMALYRYGLVGDPVFRACQRVLDAEDRCRRA